MQHIKYCDLVRQHGTATAFHMLLTLEEVANIDDQVKLADDETRYQRALEALNKINFADEQHSKKDR